MAIDATMYLYQIKLSLKDPRRILFEFLMKLEALGIKPIFVLDGQYLIEKAPEQEHRALKRQNLQDVINLLTNQLEMYRLNKTLGFELNRLAQSNPKFMTKLDSNRLNIYAIQSHISKLNREVKPIPKVVKEVFFQTCNAFGVPVITAKNDGEMLCAELSRMGLVDLVYSHDSDVFAAGAQSVIKQIDGNMVKHLSLDNILTASELEFTSFKDFCILCGTDFNKRIPGLGPITAYNLLKKYNSLESVEENTSHKLDCINYIRVREIFSSEVIPDICYTKPSKVKIFSLISDYKLYSIWSEIVRIWKF